MSIISIRKRKAKFCAQAEHLLLMANKVLAYRKDLLSSSVLAQIEEGVIKLKQSLADQKEDARTFRRLQELLARWGGHVYPIKFWSENVETFIVAAILALSVRSFFIQPFKIPTNSMYPTYAGMLHEIRLSSQRSSFLQKAYRWITLGAIPYELKSKHNWKELYIPLFSKKDALARHGYLYFEAVMQPKYFGLTKKQCRKYTLYADREPLTLSLPFDFSLDEVVLQTYFPACKDWSEVFERQDLVWKNGRPFLKLMNTTKTVQVLNFDLLTGDMLFVDRFSINFVAPKIGDPIVFRTHNIPALKEEKYYIKRLVGVGNDILEIIPPILLRNGKAIEGVKAFDKNNNAQTPYPGYVCRHRLGAGKREIVPRGFYYAMGDNSPYSSDSRYWGFVPEKEVIGRAVFILYPFTHRWGFAQ